MTNSRDVSPKRQRTPRAGNLSSLEDIRRYILEKLAEIRLVDVSDLEQEAAQNGGDLEIKSDEGTSITGGLEGILGREITGPEDIDPRHYTSLERLTKLHHVNLQKPPKKRSQRKKERN